MSLTADEHLQLGRDAVAQVESLHGDFESAVCFHFTPPAGVDGPALGYGNEAVYWAKLQDKFADLKIAGAIDGSGGEFGFEIWEPIQPSLPWLEERIPQMLWLASEVDHEFMGWTFEPPSGPVVSAAPDVAVWNAGTEEGQEKIQELIEDVERSRKAEQDK